MLIIDVRTRHVSDLLQALRAQSWVIDASDGGQYIQDPSYSQVHVDCLRDEDGVDDWLYNDAPQHIEWVGVTTKEG